MFSGKNTSTAMHQSLWPIYDHTSRTPPASISTPSKEPDCHYDSPRQSQASPYGTSSQFADDASGSSPGRPRLQPADFSAVPAYAQPIGSISDDEDDDDFLFNGESDTVYGTVRQFELHVHWQVMVRL